MKGKIVKSTNNVLVVKTEEDKILKCKIRGKFKFDNKKLLVGDNVIITKETENDGIIESVLLRKNEFIRPPVANVDQIILVFSIKEPDINVQMLDVFLCVLENKDIDIIICINKSDLDEVAAGKIREKYEKVGYRVLITNIEDDRSFNMLKDLLKDKVSVFTGPSGVGKSTMLNKFLNTDTLEVGAISEKSGRGKHTTKTIEIFELSFGGYVFDTPGFTTIDLLELETSNLASTFREFVPHLGKCKYNTCSHIKEPDCEIKKQVLLGNILEERYNTYISFYNKVDNKDSVREKSNKHYKGKKRFIKND